jgi:glycosyltransferase involved in cell wall biosynthesis
MVYHGITDNFYQKGGGIKTYLHNLLETRGVDFEQVLIHTLKTQDQSTFDVLNLHDMQLIPELQGICPTVMTLHNHDIYCPSGTQYFYTKKAKCDRAMSGYNCLSGNYVCSCGTKRPVKFLSKLIKSESSFKKLKKLKIPIIAVSHYLQEKLIINGYNPQLISVVPLGIPLAIDKPSSLDKDIHRSKKILFAGRIVLY